MQTLVKTFDIEFQASLDDLIILHEQFITGDNSHLQILAAQRNGNETISKKLVTVHLLHTSSKHNELKNRIRIDLNKFLVTLQLEAVLSMMRFQDNLMKKWPSERLIEENKTMLKLRKIVKKDGEQQHFCL